MTPLKPGMTIGVIAPAAPYVNRSDIERGVRFWEARGYHVKLSDDIFERWGYFSSSAHTRAKHLQTLFEDDRIDAVQVLWGGFGSTHLIPLIDWDVVRRNPKPFIGRSDVTALHLAIARLAGLPSFYGPGLAQVAPAESSLFTQENLLAALTSTGPLGRLPNHPRDSFVQPLSPGRGKGKLSGGCLWPLCKSIGTPWQPDFRNKIVFIEEVDEPPWSMDAHLTHLQQSGMFEGVAGVVLGRFVNCEWSKERAEHPSGFSLEDVLDRHFANFPAPVLYRVPCGHEPDTLTLLFGVDVELDAEGLTVVESPFQGSL